MDRRKKIAQLLSTIAAAVAVVAAQQAAAWVQTRGLPAWFPAMVALVVVAILSQFLKYVLESVLDASRLLRRLLLGRQFIEGTWLDISFKEGAPYVFGMSRIDAAGASVRVAGEDFAVNGIAQGHFVADILSLDWPKMKYKYTYQSSMSAALSNQGYNETQFFERDGPPRRYVGFYFDLLEGKRTTFEGWRVDDEAILDRLDDVSRRRETIVSFFAERLRDLPPAPSGMPNPPVA